MRRMSGGAAGHPLGKVPVLFHGSFALAEPGVIVLDADRAFDGLMLHSRDPATTAPEEMCVSVILSAAEPVLVRQMTLAYRLPDTADGSARHHATAPLAAD